MSTAVGRCTGDNISHPPGITQAPRWAPNVTPLLGFVPGSSGTKARTLLSFIGMPHINKTNKLPPIINGEDHNNF